ncbi:MAG: coenzyme F420 hydrogenase [Candidatus Latescibacteria bacterium]|jgi:coenzyme F420 hydrogenase subunit beta|nr:coenzyme F420 hydrogenase [Candidatus Latescibacterota bacterium]
MKHDKVKSFHDLIEEVQSRGICGRCGGCVAFCSAGELHALRFGKDGVAEFANEDSCLKCGICYLVCPEIKVLDDELRKKFHWKKPIGFYRNLRSAKTTVQKVASEATDGGVVTSLLLYALEKNLIDGAVVSHRTGPFSRVPAVVTTAEEIIDAAGSHFDDVASLGKFGSSYTSFVPGIKELGKLRQRGLNKLAFIGTPCQVYSLRKMQALKVVPSDNIALVIGLFCMENFSFTKRARQKLGKNLGVNLDNVVKLNIKDDIIMTMSSGAVLHVPFEIMDEVARSACFACSDFANEYADISCGGLGSPDGYTTVMVRTSEGERLYNGARQKGFIKEMKFRKKEQSLLHRTTQMAKIVSFTRRKQERKKRVMRSL